MEPKFQSSFIPKGPIATAASTTAAPVQQKTIIGFLARAIFVLAILASLGVFGYNLYLKSSIRGMGADLEQAKATIDPSSITNLSRLNQRIVTTDQLLKNHSIISPVFEFLEEATLKNVRFMTFNFDTTDKGVVLTLSGQARNYSALALQADAFAKSKYFKNPVFSGLNLDDKGNVTFTFTAVVDPTLISYSKRVEKRGVAPVVPIQSQAATSTGTSTPSSVGTTTPKTSTSTTLTR